MLCCVRRWLGYLNHSGSMHSGFNTTYESKTVFIQTIHVVLALSSRAAILTQLFKKGEQTTVLNLLHRVTCPMVVGSGTREAVWWGRRWAECPQDGAVPLHWGGKAAALPLPGLLPCMLRISTEITGIMHLLFQMTRRTILDRGICYGFLDYV